MHLQENILRERARWIARGAGLDENLAIHSLRGITVKGGILAAAKGQTNSTPVIDDNAAVPVDGDCFRLKGLGEEHWTLVGMVTNEVAGTDAGWGIRNFYENSRGIDQISFAPDSSLGDRGLNASYMSLEAMKSGIDPFPWQQMPAFGPNSFVDVAAFNDTGALIAAVSAQFWIMPVPANFKPLGYKHFTCKCPHAEARLQKYGTFTPTPTQVATLRATVVPTPPPID
jgi:hypothetical protein